MSYIIFLICSFLLVYLIYELFVIKKERALKKMKKSKDVLILCKLSKLDNEKVNFKKLVRILALTNASIISIMGTLVLLLNNIITNFYIWILVSSVLTVIVLLPLIMGCYKIVGNKLKKEGR